MEPELVTEDELLDVLAALRDREPLFHRRELVGSRVDFERETAADFWETAASGRRFSREYVWSVLAERFAASGADEFETEAWQTRDHYVRRIAPDTYLLTYTLFGQGGRLTRRLSVWQGSVDDGWQVLYHQGTVATD
jgi:hypothetical protein